MPKLTDSRPPSPTATASSELGTGGIATVYLVNDLPTRAE